MEANDVITRIKKAVVSSMKKNGAGEITELYLNEVKQNFPENNVTANTSVPVLLCAKPEPSAESGFIFIFKADGTIIDDVADLADAETAIFITDSGCEAFSTLSADEFTEKYGFELSYLVTVTTIENDEENKVLSFDNSDFNYTQFENKTVFTLCAIGRSSI